MSEKLVHEANQYVSLVSLESAYAPDLELDWYTTAVLKRVIYACANPNWATFTLTIAADADLKALAIRASVEEK